LVGFDKIDEDEANNDHYGYKDKDEKGPYETLTPTHLQVLPKNVAGGISSSHI